MSEGMSDGALAGIIVASIIGAFVCSCLIVVLCYYRYRQAPPGRVDERSELLIKEGSVRLTP